MRWRKHQDSGICTANLAKGYRAVVWGDDYNGWYGSLEVGNSKGMNLEQISFPGQYKNRKDAQLGTEAEILKLGHILTAGVTLANAKGPAK